MNNKFTSFPPTPRNYAQELIDRFDAQERVLNGMAELDRELVGLLRSIVQTQTRQEQILAAFAKQLEALQPPSAAA